MFEPVHVEVEIVLKTLNTHENVMVRSKRRRAERAKVEEALRSFPRPDFKDGHKLRVVITRVGLLTLDSDNLVASAKSVRDEVASWLGVDDASPLVQWHCTQERRSELLPHPIVNKHGKVKQKWRSFVKIDIEHVATDAHFTEVPELELEDVREPGIAVLGEKKCTWLTNPAVPLVVLQRTGVGIHGKSTTELHMEAKQYGGVKYVHLSMHWPQNLGPNKVCRSRGVAIRAEELQAITNALVMFQAEVQSNGWPEMPPAILPAPKPRPKKEKARTTPTKVRTMARNDNRASLVRMKSVLGPVFSLR